MKYSKQIKYEIYKLISTHNTTVKTLCRIIGIDRSTYYQWLHDKKDFGTLVEYARAKYSREKMVAVKNALYKRAIGYIETSTSTITNSGGLKQKRVHVRPCYKSLVYILEHFREDKKPSNEELIYESVLERDFQIEDDAEYELSLEEQIEDDAEYKKSPKEQVFEPYNTDKEVIPKELSECDSEKSEYSMNDGANILEYSYQ